MQVEAIKMDPRVARIHYLDYRKKVWEHREERKKKLDEEGKKAGKELGRVRIAKGRLEREDEALMKAYRQLSLGERIIDVRDAMMKAGVDEEHFPRLAIAKAGARRCHFDPTWRSVGGNTAKFYDETADMWNSRHLNKIIRFNRDTFPAETWNDNWRKAQRLRTYPIHTVVPTVPPHLRPKNLSDYYILWEVDEWTSSGPEVAPGDPLLLKRVTESFYVIVAQWDLTPLEQRVLEGSL